MINIEDIKSNIKISLNNRDTEEALKYIRDGLRINIEDSSLYYDMGSAYEIKGDNDRAYLCFENALNYEKDDKKKYEIINKLSQFEIDNNIRINKLSIIILTYNNLEYTKKCISSITSNNRVDNYEIVIVDNASTDRTREWLKMQSGIKYVLNDKNMGFPAGCNVGIHAAQKENDIMLLNNDTIIMPNSIFNLRMALYSEDDVAMCGSVSNNVSYFQNINEKFSTRKGYFDYALRNNIPDSNRYDYRLKLIGFAMIINRQCLDDVGELDERFTPGNFEDDDLGLRMIKGGYKNILCRDSFIFHFGSVSFLKERNKYVNLLTVNSEKFKDKWGFSSLESAKINYNILNLLECERDKEIKVLEIGCQCGGNLLELKNKYKNVKLYGIEPNKECAQVSEMIAEVKCCRIAGENLDYQEEFFDYIILSNALEKCYDPFEFLIDVKRILKKDGYILVSTNNVMNFNLVNSLINGNWSYTTGGVLDNENIRFFTLKEIYVLLNKAGYSEMTSTAGILPVTAEDKKFVDGITALAKTPDVAVHLQSYEYYTRAKKLN